MFEFRPAHKENYLAVHIILSEPITGKSFGERSPYVVKVSNLTDFLHHNLLRIWSNQPPFQRIVFSLLVY